MSDNQENQNQSEGDNTKPNMVGKYEYEVLSEDYTNFDLSFKIIVIGDSGVGKSCLTNNAIKNTFNDAYNATVGFEFFTFNIKLNDKVIKLQIWDTCGQELYRSLITNFYRNTSLAIIVYAINVKDTFEDIEMWLRELRAHSSPDAKVFLIGNKVDLENEREVKKEEAEAYGKQNNVDLFMEASAKTGINAQLVFIKAAQILYDNYNLYQDKKINEKPDLETEGEEDNHNQKLNANADQNDNKGCC